MLKGYILIKLVPGFESTVLSSIRAIPGVLEVNPVFGHWDTVAIAEAKTLHELSSLCTRGSGHGNTGAGRGIKGNC
jgi:hypothetical protein